jgi:hypothetical protein
MIEIISKILTFGGVGPTCKIPQNLDNYNQLHSESINKEKMNELLKYHGLENLGSEKLISLFIDCMKMATNSFDLQGLSEMKLRSAPQRIYNLGLFIMLIQIVNFKSNNLHNFSDENSLKQINSKLYDQIIEKVKVKSKTIKHKLNKENINSLSHFSISIDHNNQNEDLNIEVKTGTPKAATPDILMEEDQINHEDEVHVSNSAYAEQIPFDLNSDYFAYKPKITTN